MPQPTQNFESLPEETHGQQVGWPREPQPTSSVSANTEF